jgi:hypothetical protein
MSAVYFLNAVSSGWIKIEYSKRPLKRVSGSNTFCPHELSLLKVIEGGYDIEKEWHRRFAPPRSRACGARARRDISAKTARSPHESAGGSCPPG